MSEALYPECSNCVARPFCKVLKGEVKPVHSDWCRGNFRLEAALKLAEIPKRYRAANLFNFQVDEYNKVSYDLISNQSLDIVKLVEEGKNFFFYGNRPGAGKTYLAACVLNQFIYKVCMTSRFDFENPLGLFVTFPDLIDELRYNRDDDALGLKMLEILNAPLLLLDDVGAGNITDFVREQTFRIVNYRLNKGLSTIVTSNYSLSQLASPEMLGNRIASRFALDTIGLEMNGPDRRRGR